MGEDTQRSGPSGNGQRTTNPPPLDSAAQDTPTLRLQGRGATDGPVPSDPARGPAGAGLPEDEPTVTLAPGGFVAGADEHTLRKGNALHNGNAIHQRYLGPENDDWPVFTSPSRPLLRDPERRQTEASRRTRRRRRYAMFLRRNVRSRHDAKSAAVVRAAWATVLVMVLLIVSVITASVSVAASYYQSELGLIHGLQRTIAAKDSVRIFDSKGVLLYELRSNGAQHSIPLAQIPVTVVNATVAIEDKDFWSNQGVDFTSIARAAVKDVQTRRVEQGGSTITQQLIKGQLLGGDPTFTRKLNEVILALGITEQNVYTKRQIMEMYLNSIPYSPTAYGIDAAAREYFGYQDDPNTGVSAAQHLDLAQSSMLAGVPQNPNTNDPLLHPQKALSRQRDVLAAMVANGYITQAQATAALAESAKPNFFHPTTQEQNLAPHFVYYVLDQLQQMVDAGQLHDLARSGLNVYTTLDLSMQNQVQKYMEDHLYGNDIAGYGGYIRNSNVTNSAAVLADHHSGAIKVLLGSVDYYSTTIDGKFNVATDGYRGPGSSFKPIVYATAFQKGWFPALTIADMPTTFWDEGQQKPYKPLDFTRNEFRGELTLRTALQFSLNIPAVKTMEFAGVDDVKVLSQRMGITKIGPNSTYGLSTVLGALGVTPLEMTQAYSVFANYGQYIPLHAIDVISDTSNNTLFQYHVPQPVQVLSPQVAYMISSVLSDNPARAGDFGACSQLYLDADLGGDCAYYGGNSPNAWPAAVKTGTGQDFVDDWTVGYTTDYTMGVWVGNDDNTSMRNIDGVTGAAPIWHNSMIYAERNLPKTQFPVPSGLQRASYTSNGITTTDWFLAGTLPPSGIGNGGPAILPCITEPDTGGWEYSSTNCVGSIKPVHY